MSHIRIFKHYIPSPLVVLGALELCLLFLSLVAGNAIRFNWEDEIVWESRLVVSAAVYALVLLACSAAMGVYQAGYRDGVGAMAVRTVVAYCLLGCGLLTIIYYILPQLYMGRGVLAYSIITSLFILIPVRWVFFKLVDAESLRTRSLVLGAGNRANQLATRLAQSHVGVAYPVGFVRTSSNEDVAVTRDVLPHSKSLGDMARECDASEIVVALDERRVQDGIVFPLDELFDSKLRGIRVVEAITMYERELGILELDEMRPGWMVFASGFSNSVIWDSLKRTSDVVIALSLLLIIWPVMLLTALLIMLETGRPVIYRQTRVGLNGDEFEILKFRSMTVDAEKDGKAIWADANDSRITRVGAVIRNTRIDELPQLYNVLRGDMSIVGPRPERPEFVEDLDKKIPFYKERHRVKPGLMGWAQLNYPYGASVEDAAQKLRYDLYYVKNRSLMLDLIIMVQTVQVILLGTGVR